jgi:hypothetical protein
VLSSFEPGERRRQRVTQLAGRLCGIVSTAAAPFVAYTITAQALIDPASPEATVGGGRSSGGAFPAAPPTAGDLADQFERLARMHKAGELTDKEFTTAKSRLLSGDDVSRGEELHGEAAHSDGGQPAPVLTGAWSWRARRRR